MYWLNTSTIFTRKSWTHKLMGKYISFIWFLKKNMTKTSNSSSKIGFLGQVMLEVNSYEFTHHRLFGWEEIQQATPILHLSSVVLHLEQLVRKQLFAYGEFLALFVRSPLFVTSVATLQHQPVNWTKLVNKLSFIFNQDKILENIMKPKE